MSLEEYDRIVREMIHHESELIDHRMTWMWTLQGLLLTALGFLWEKDAKATFAICSLGLISSISLGYSMLVSIRAVNLLIQDWKQRLGDQVALYPRIEALQGHEIKYRHLLPWRLFPALFPLLWFCLGIVRCL